MTCSGLRSPILATSVMDRPADLPDFEHPPIVEVALSVQFEPLPLRTQHIALLWEACRSDFPEWQDQAPIAPTFEIFGNAVGGAHSFLRPPALRRAIFRNGEGSQLKQYQADRYVRNWTKAPTAPNYPRYESIRDHFADDLRTLIRFTQEQSLGRFVPNQCEVTYVNLIPLPGDAADTVAEVINPWKGQYSDQFLERPESSEIEAHFVMKQDTLPIGRLHIAVSGVTILETNTRALQLTLTARGEPASSGVDSVVAFLNLGRDYIVKGFTSFTTPAMHKSWGRRDGNN